MIDYIRNGLPKITMGEILAFGAILVAFCKAVEDIFGKKYLGTWAWNKIKSFFLFPVTILKKLDFLEHKMVSIEKEFKTNGGSTVKDDLKKISVNVDAALVEAKTNGVKLTELDLRLKISEECDPTLIFKLDATGKCIYCNQSFYSFFGFSERDILGFNWENKIDEKDLRVVQEKWKRAIETQTQFLNTHTVIDSDKVKTVCRVIGLPIVLDGTLKGFYGTVTPQ